MWLEPQGAIGATGATGPKLEIGTISTPHSQAPEDILN